MQYFQDIVGQEHIKGRLAFYIAGAKKTGVFPTMAILGQKGNGKTHIARKTSKVLHDITVAKSGQPKHLIELNSSTVKNPQDFVDSVYYPHIENRDATLFLDELHALPKKMEDMLLSALEPSGVVNKVRVGSTEMVFDFTRLTVIGGTTEPQEVFAPLLNRFDQIKLVDYKPSELAQIIQRNITDVSLTTSALEQLASLSRGNARSAVGFAKQVNRYRDVEGVAKLTNADVEKLIRILDVFPLGLTRWEVNMLRLLKERRSMSLTALCAATGLTRSAQQSDESYLLKLGLMEIDGQRKLTDKGRKYLDSL